MSNFNLEELAGRYTGAVTHGIDRVYLSAEFSFQSSQPGWFARKFLNQRPSSRLIGTVASNEICAPRINGLGEDEDFTGCDMFSAIQDRTTMRLVNGKLILVNTDPIWRKHFKVAARDIRFGLNYHPEYRTLSGEAHFQRRNFDGRDILTLFMEKQ